MEIKIKYFIKVDLPNIQSVCQIFLGSSNIERWTPRTIQWIPESFGKINQIHCIDDYLFRNLSLDWQSKFCDQNTPSDLFPEIVTLCFHLGWLIT